MPGWCVASYILAWVGGGPDEDGEDTNYIQYLEARYLSSETIVGVMRLDSFYRICAVLPWDFLHASQL